MPPELIFRAVTGFFKDHKMKTTFLEATAHYIQFL